MLNKNHNKAKPDNSYKEMFFWFVLAFLISLIILIASVGNFTGVLTWVFGGPDGKIAGASVIDSVANSYSLIFGIPVALAGSIVAIKLAQRAVAVSERQEFYENVKLIDEDIHKLEENNRLLADSIRRFASSSFRLKAFVYEQLLQSASGKSVDIEMPSEEGFAELLKGKTFSLLCEKLIKEKENLVNCAVLGFQNPAIFDYIKGVDKFELEDVAGEVVLEAHNRNARAEAAYNGSDSWDLIQNALKKQTSTSISNLTDAMFFLESHLVSEDTILKGLYDYFNIDKPFTYRYSMLDTENEMTCEIDRDDLDGKLLDESIDFHKLSKLRDMNYVEISDILLAGKLLCSENVSFKIGLESRYKRPEINVWSVNTF